MNQHRRTFMTLLGSVAVVGFAARGFITQWMSSAHADTGKEFPVHMSDADWKKKLSPQAYNVLREQGTERAFTSPLNDEHRHGTFYCAGCENKLFSSDQKFNSGTGWPSFWAPIDPKAVETTSDSTYGMTRIEVHCAHCGGHLGHVFNDGPQPTGLRYCMNGVAMDFKPEA